jgi:hypothetical protein
MGDLLIKLALGVEKNDSKSSESKGSESGIGSKKTSDGKKFPFGNAKEKDNKGDTKHSERNDNEKKNEKVPGFGKKIENKDGKNFEGGNENEGKNSDVNGESGANGTGEKKENGMGVGGENEIEGNESAEGPAVPGTGSINPTTIIDFFAQNPAPNDESYHEFAESQGMDIHQAEAVAYALAGKYVMFLRGGKSAGADINQIDPEQLKIGMEVESEHTSDPATQKKISFDHLVESGDYYQKLRQMESGGGQVVAQPKDNKPAFGKEKGKLEEKEKEGNNPFEKGKDNKGEGEEKKE